MNIYKIIKKIETLNDNNNENDEQKNQLKNHRSLDENKLVLILNTYIRMLGTHPVKSIINEINELKAKQTKLNQLNDDALNQHEDILGSILGPSGLNLDTKNLVQHMPKASILFSGNNNSSRQESTSTMQPKSQNHSETDGPSENFVYKLNPPLRLFDDVPD